MPEYKLNTSFTGADLTRFLAAGSNVVVAKPNNGGQPNVAWVVYRPLEKNAMTWEEEYGIYASNADLISGGELFQMSKTGFPAVAGKLYSMTDTGAFGPPTSGGSAGSYTAVNGYANLPKGFLTIGLFQDAVVNGNAATGNAVSAATVQYNYKAVMTPYTTVYLWMQSQVVSNSVLTVVTSPMTKVTFGGSVTDISLAYDATSGTFIPPSDNQLAAGLSVDHYAPAVL
ncbi:MAG TPA: hypothetical protein VH333_26600 [Pseudonocardiaceae bacterium]|nr:hypothetical protein [Pseudonocardiaceae bacterium]